MAQKFIITADGELRLGNVHMHRDLVDPWEDCWGGGFWALDIVTRQLMLDGASYDFGAPQWGRLIREGKPLCVSDKYIGIPIVYTREDGSLLHVSQVFDIQFISDDDSDGGNDRSDGSNRSDGGSNPSGGGSAK